MLAEKFRELCASTLRRWRVRSDQRVDGNRPPDADSMFDRVLAISEGLPDRTALEFEGVRAVYTLVMGSVYHVAQRLIDAKQRGSAPNGPDEALIVLCNRLYNESFAGYVVLSHGLLGAGRHHTRAAIETANLAILFLLKPDHAESWLGGKKYPPGRVRELIDAPEEVREWYSWLSTMTHTNYAASRASVFRLNDQGDQVLFYGGYYAPRAMASATMRFVWIALGFLHLFYECYSERLEELRLLWPAAQLASLADEHGLTWDMYLKFLEAFAEDVNAEILALPEDEVGSQVWADSIRPDR
ncbi:MAG: hypothetical protein F4X25_12530 [Chloroflexi bacterium]|nr:hypothetical protein [Chloroflexota bacterium]